MSENTTVIPKSSKVDDITITKNTDNELQAIGIVPVGSVVSWFKSMSGVPTLPVNFVECDGSIINDSDSPLNGQTLPNLNGNNNFLRGNSTSGTLGGSSTHQHLSPLGINGNHTGVVSAENVLLYDSFGSLSYQGVRDSAKIKGSSVVYTISEDSFQISVLKTQSVSSDPSYVDVVWIMRIK